MIALLPVEVVDKNKAALSKLKVGKMSETGVLTGTGATAVLDIDKDSDRFYIRVPGGAALGGISVKVSTTDNPDHTTTTPYDDNATQIDLVSDGADAISKSMLLVSDDVDDDHPVDSIADDTTGDRTHKIQLGGNFKIEEIKIGTGAWQTLGTKVPVPVEKAVDVTTVILRDKPQAAGGVELISQTVVTSFWKIANERYAQRGVRLNVTHAGVKDPPTGVDLSPPGLNVTDSSGADLLAGNGIVSQESKDLITGLGTGASSADIHVFYVNTLTVAGFPAGGAAIADFAFAASEDTFTYNVVLSNPTLSPWGGYAAERASGGRSLLRRGWQTPTFRSLPPIFRAPARGLALLRALSEKRAVTVDPGATRKACAKAMIARGRRASLPGDGRVPEEIHVKIVVGCSHSEKSVRLSPESRKVPPFP